MPFCGQAEDVGVDLKPFFPTRQEPRKDNMSYTAVDSLVREQRHRWQVADAFSGDTPLEELQTTLAELREAQPNAAVRDSKGHPVLHVAAANDRTDVVVWLVQDTGADIGERDRQGCTALEVAWKAGSVACTDFLSREAAGRVLARSLPALRRRWQTRRLAKARHRAAACIQAAWKGYATRELHYNRLVKNLECRQQFYRAWRSSIRAVKQLSPANILTWADLHARYNMTAGEVLDAEDAFVERVQRQQVLQRRTTDVSASSLDFGVAAMPEDERSSSGGDAQPTPHVADVPSTDDAASPPRLGSAGAASSHAQANDTDASHSDGVVVEEIVLPDLENIMLTAHVIRWFRGKATETHHRKVFCRRMEQLANGERSRILSKRLTGSKHTIFESYFEMTGAGRRILWTECMDEGGVPSILIWFVSKHKHVQKRMQQIDSSLADRRNQVMRSQAVSRQGDAEPHGVLVLQDGNEVLLDPERNSPLKIYELPRDSISSYADDDDWAPDMKTTVAEKIVLGKPGTVLVLGRSGTGKTICITNRMSRDRQLALANTGAPTSAISHQEGGVDAADALLSPIRQLFVARSQRICSIVKSFQRQYCSPEHLANSDFCQFDTLVRRVSAKGPAAQEQGRALFVRSSRVDFERFKASFYPLVRKACSVGPLVLWMQIRSFIKGSIQAVMKGAPLSLGEYLALGKKRCTLGQVQREEAHAGYRQYRRFLEQHDLHDDMDRLFDVFENQMPPSQYHPFEVPPHGYHKIYVDEVQDYTQAELAFLVMLTDPASLFFAGDTAQAIEQGVAFRFEDLRQVMYELLGSDSTHVPDKPHVLKVNAPCYPALPAPAPATEHPHF